jgi:hypothetical protein
MDYETFSHNSITHILYISYHGIIYVPVATHGHSPSYNYKNGIQFQRNKRGVTVLIVFSELQNSITQPGLYIKPRVVARE